MVCKLVYILMAALALRIIGAARVMCPSDPNCVCGGTLAVELNCDIDGRIVKINLLPNTYINIKCENVTSLDYNKLPKCANRRNSFKSVSFKDCPLPTSSFKDVLTNMGVSKTMALIFQNAKNLSGYFDRRHFAGLQDLTKLLLSVNGITHLPDNLFTDINNLTWLNIRSHSINLSEELFKPLERLETLEISHNHMTNISSNLFSHLSFLRKLSLWQSNVTWFSKDFFTGIDVLEELDLSSNGLNELPGSIFKPLRKLKKLTLFSNKFSSLPRNLFKNNDKLETVIILNNDVKLKSLPRFLFASLPDLKQIYIQRCGLEDLSYDVFANSPLITNISLAYNDITNLPESIFNDQINLLELDLSHNKLRSLEPKLFSSLVRLENLNLCYNSIQEISGSTFSSLLSLIYLNMENNGLTTISSYLFSNNKQKMSISMAYNKLSFEMKEPVNNSIEVKRISPFAHTYNLRLLNLSHNEFKTPFDDWWLNGHDILDISYNSLRYLRDDKHQTVESKRSCQRIFKKPLKELWISKNPYECKCEYFQFINCLQEYTKTKIADIKSLQCPIWKEETCYWRFIVFISLAAISGSLSIIVMILYVVYRNEFNLLLKKRFYSISNQNAKRSENNTIKVKYSQNDEDFVLKEVLPVLNDLKNNKLIIEPTNNASGKHSIISNLSGNNKEKYPSLVIFSPNYLTSCYSNVNIKKIRGEMLKAKNTVYIFTDIGPENSIFAFLKDQRDRRTTVVWNEPNCWNKVLAKLSKFNKKKDVGQRNDIGIKTKSVTFSMPKAKFPQNNSFTRLPDWQNLYDFQLSLNDHEHTSAVPLSESV